MKLNELRPSDGALTSPFRKGRGVGTGNGKTAGRGHKGQRARSGGGVRPQFEGGQMPLYRRLPKRGFNNTRFAKRYLIVNVGDLNAFEAGATVDLESLKALGILTVPKVNDGLKVLGEGELTTNVTVKASAFTASAKAKIEAAGGTIEEI